MARELRRIYLNTVDLTHALDAFRTDKPAFLPHGQLSQIEIGPENLLLKIEMKYVDNVHVLEYKIDYDKLVEVLIAFCNERRITVPGNSRKSAFADGDEVVLEIAIPDDSADPSQSTWPRFRDRVA
ncbi:MAG: hypothetical protein ACREFD_19475 [Stellaceae bacterium]